MNILDAANATVHDYPGGSESLGPRLGLSAAMLRSKVDLDNGMQQLSVAEADRIMALTGDFRMLKAWAHQHGFLVVESPDRDASGYEMEALEQGLGARVAGGQFAPHAPATPAPAAAVAATTRLGEQELHATRAAESALQALVARMAQRREHLVDRVEGMSADACSSAAHGRSGHAFSCEREADVEPSRRTGC